MILRVCDARDAPSDGRGAAARRALAFAMMLGCLVPLASRSAEVACRQAGITVTGATAQDGKLVCAAVEDALAFLQPAGLHLERGPAIHLVGKLPASTDSHSLGRFDGRRGVIELLDYRAAVSATECGPRAFKVPMSHALWQSFVAHEIAHAAVHAYDTRGTVRRAQHEYVAAVVQLSTLPDAIRAEILDHYDDLPAFGDASEISDLLYYMAPCEFAVKAYRHYLAPGNGSGFISRLLSPPRRRP